MTIERRSFLAAAIAASPAALVAQSSRLKTSAPKAVRVAMVRTGSASVITIGRHNGVPCDNEDSGVLFVM